MEHSPSLTQEPRFVSGLERLFRLCESFAAAWQAGERPQIERYLDKASEPDLLLLLPELLRVELADRKRRGERPTAEEYQARFPAHADLIAFVFNAEQRLRSGELEAGVTLGDFRIEKRIGAGGMGVVYLARQLSLNRLAALKVLGSALTDQKDITRFKREAQAIARLNHPGIAEVYFIGQDPDVCYLAMEYVAGMSLRELMRKLVTSELQAQTIDDILQATPAGENAPEVRYDGPTQPYPPEPTANEEPISPGNTAEKVKRLLSSPAYIRRCCEIVRDAALALAHAHERGVIHRDIKPENILLDRDGKPHLIDFGLARYYEDVTLTNTGALVGTPMYMSPEQVSGRFKLDQRTDVYSLGLVLYEVLSLRRPVIAPSREGILRCILTKDFALLKLLNPEVPQALENVVHKATQRDPDERYAGAGALATELQRVLDGRPVSAARYHYKFDESEIAAERPWGVILAVSIYLLLSLYHLISSISIFGTYVYSMFRMNQHASHESLLNALIYMAIGIGSLFIVVETYRGRRFAWSIMVISCIYVIYIYVNKFYISIKYYIQHSHDYNKGKDYFYRDIDNIIAYMSISCVAIITFCSLIARRTRRWFELARRLRREHRRSETPYSE